MAVGTKIKNERPWTIHWGPLSSLYIYIVFIPIMKFLRTQFLVTIDLYPKIKFARLFRLLSIVLDLILIVVIGF